MSDFKGRHFRGEIVLWAVRLYCRYAVSYRDLEAMNPYVRFATEPSVGGCEKPRINGEHKIWGLTSGDDVFSQIGRLVAGSSLPAMNTRCVRTLGRVTRRAGAQRRSREEA